MQKRRNRRCISRSSSSSASIQSRALARRFQRRRKTSGRLDEMMPLVGSSPCSPPSMRGAQSHCRAAGDTTCPKNAASLAQPVHHSRADHARRRTKNELRNSSRPSWEARKGVGGRSDSLHVGGASLARATVRCPCVSGAAAAASRGCCPFVTPQRSAIMCRFGSSAVPASCSGAARAPKTSLTGRHGVTADSALLSRPQGTSLCAFLNVAAASPTFRHSLPHASAARPSIFCTHRGRGH